MMDKKRRLQRTEPEIIAELPSVVLSSDGTVAVSAESSGRAAKLALQLFKKQSRRLYTGIEYR